MTDVNPSQFVIYQSEDGRTKLDVRFVDETVWLTQKLMAELFAVDVRTISEHLKNIFASGELAEDSVIRKFRITAADEKNGRGAQCRPFAIGPLHILYTPRRELS